MDTLIHELTKILGDQFVKSALMGSGTMLLLAVLKAAGKQVDANHAVDPYRPFLNKALVGLTLGVAVLKSILEGHAAGAPWDQVVNALMFLVGGRATPTHTATHLTHLASQSVLKVASSDSTTS